MDLYVTIDLRTMIAIWFGKLAWDAGVRSGRVEVIGPRELRERLSRWFLLSPIRVKSAAPAGGDRMTPVSADPVVGKQPAAALHQ